MEVNMNVQSNSLIWSGGDSSIALYEKPVCNELIRRGLDNLEKRDAEYWFTRGEEHRKLGDLKNAIECYEKALEIDSKHGSSLFWEGFCLLHHICECFKDDPQKEHPDCAKKAADVYERLLGLHEEIERPEEFYAADYNNYAVAKSKLGFSDIAFTYYKKAVEADKTYYVAWSNLGSSYRDKKQYNEAQRCLGKSLELCREYSGAYYTFGLLCNDLGEYEKATKHFENFLGLVDHNLAREKDGIEYAKKKIAELGKLKIRTELP
jgi:tetratricopeptide (TPR) repeat protein